MEVIKTLRYAVKRNSQYKKKREILYVLTYFYANSYVWNDFFYPVFVARWESPQLPIRRPWFQIHIIKNVQI